MIICTLLIIGFIAAHARHILRRLTPPPGSWAGVVVTAVGATLRFLLLWLLLVSVLIGTVAVLGTAFYVIQAARLSRRALRAPGAWLRQRLPRRQAAPASLRLKTI